MTIFKRITEFFKPSADYISLETQLEFISDNFYKVEKLFPNIIKIDDYVPFYLIEDRFLMRITTFQSADAHGICYIWLVDKSFDPDLELSNVIYDYPRIISNNKISIDGPWIEDFRKLLNDTGIKDMIIEQITSDKIRELASIQKLEKEHLERKNKKRSILENYKRM